MFGSTSPFGQSSSSPFASQSVFGQTNNTNTNPFAPNPSFGNVIPFGSQTSGSIFGGTSTGVFGAAQSSSPFASTTAFGASSSPAFGSSTPAFGSSSTPAFGSSSSSFGASPVFGQKPAFGFGSTTTQSSPFGSTTQQSQPAFGSGIFGSTQSAFSATSTPAFGATSTPAFGATSTPAFGATSTPAFGSTGSPAFGSTGSAFGVSNAPVFGAGGTFGASSAPTFGTSSTPAFGASSTPAFGASSTPSFSFGSAFGQSTPAFGSFGAPSTPAFGATATPAFGATSTPAFGSTSTPAFGSTSTPAFGATSTPAFGSTGSAFGTPNTSVFGAGGTFGASSTPAFGASSTPSFSFGSSPAFGQSTPAFGSSPFGTTTFGAQSSSFGSQSSTPAFGSTSFGQSPFGGQRGGSRITPYSPTTEADGGSGTQPAGKLESISAMPAYKDKSHEELRWEDYQSGDKGGPNSAAQPAAGIGFGVSTATSNPFGSTSTFGQTSASPFSSTITNPFSLKPPSFSSTGFTTSATASNPFQSTSSSLFGPTSSMTTSIFGTGSSLFGSSVTPSFSTSPSIFGTGVAPATTPTFGTGLNFSGSQTSPLFSSTPAIGQTGNAFGQVTSTFGQNTNFGQSNIFNTPSTGFSGNMFSNSLSFAPSSSPAPFGQTTPSFSSPFQPAQTSGAFSFSNFGQAQPGGGSSIFGQSNIGLSSATPNASVAQPFTNPYGTLPAMPQMSIGRTGTAPSVQYGISSMPVVDKPLPVRISPLLTSRYLSQRRIRLPARKYRPDKDSPKVPFFSDDEETPSVPKADAVFFPRENPRSLIIRPTENWPSRASAEKGSPLKHASAPLHENGKNSYDGGSKAEDKDDNHGENGHVKDQIHPVKGNQKANGIQDDHSAEKEDSYKTIGGHRAGEAAIVYEHGADIEALMPKLRRSDYFTEPRIQVLAARERAEPGYCRRVKDFVVGRHGYGSIKFLGETDVRCLDLESLIQFNNREVIVYLDDSKKPPVGQGLNKPAEVTLLNIKCFDKRTAEQYTEGARVEKYKNMLKRKAEEQGAAFLSYDPIKGEWKFKVDHFSTYKLEDEDKDHL